MNKFEPGAVIIAPDGKKGTVYGIKDGKYLVHMHGIGRRLLLPEEMRKVEVSCLRKSG